MEQVRQVRVCFLFLELALVAEEAEGRSTKWSCVTGRGFCFT